MPDPTTPTKVPWLVFVAGLALGVAVTESYELNRLPRTGEVRSWFEPENGRPTGSWVHQIGSLSGQRYKMHTPNSECDICGPVEERQWKP